MKKELSFTVLGVIIAIIATVICNLMIYSAKMTMQTPLKAIPVNEMYNYIMLIKFVYFFSISAAVILIVIDLAERNARFAKFICVITGYHFFEIQVNNALLDKVNKK